MAEAVILSAIESLDCWLRENGGFMEENNLEKVYSLIVGMSDLGEEKKKMVHTLLLQFGMEERREINKEKLYKLLDMNKEKMYSLVVGMADFWEDYKGKLYHLLFQVGNRVDLKGKLYRSQHSLREKITNRCGRKKRELNKEKLHSLLVEIADMWGDDEGEVNKEKLHSLLLQMLKKENYLKKKIMCRISGEVAGLWKDKQPKLNKGKLHAWLANKVDLCEPKKLFGVLLDMVLLYDSSSYFHEAIREGVEGAKREFRMILDLVTDKKMGEESSLRYFISSDVVDMAHHARFLIQLEGSDPFALYFELSEYQALEHQTYYKWFSEEFKHIANGLQEIKVNLEKVGSNMAKAVILRAIKSLECWLRKKGNLVEENLENLYSLIVGMSDLGEEKEIVHSLLLHFGMDLFEYEGERKKEKLYRLTVGMSDLGEEKKEMLHSLLWMTENGFSKAETEETVHMFYELLDLNKEKMKSLVEGMADFWEDNNEKLYALLFLVALIWEDDKGEFYRVLFEGRRPYWRELKKEKLHRLLVEITDLWGDDEGELNKVKLHRLLFQMLDSNNYSGKKVICGISGEVEGLWKDKQPKLNKEKLYTWFANKLDLCEPEKLFAMLLYASSHVHKKIREGVDGAKREFRMILDFITDKKLEEESSLRYFISDVVDNAHHAHSLIHLKDSHPFALFCGLTVYKDPIYEIYYPAWFRTKFEHIVEGLQEIKDSMLGSRVERLQNVREMEGSKNVVGLKEDVKSLLLCDKNIIVIKGMAGIGKTTLARQVYNHTNIAQQFQRRAWVCLSRVDDSRKEILVSLIQQLVDSNEFALLEKIEHADYKSLKQMLRQQLLMEQCFIVLDDVWDNTTHWKYVMKALPKGRNSGSRLLLTTRSVSINNYGVYYHKMRCMDDDKSWILLLKTLSIEGSDEEFPKPLVKEARQILRRKCSGLPLPIKEVGRHWAKKRQSGSEWEELIESIDLSETLRALESSYDNWNPKLKSYFLHLAFFKEGATIRVKRLLHIWKVMEVLRFWEGQTCLTELLNESVIEASDMGYDKELYTPNIKTCSIHAIFHMLSIRKAEDELNFEILNKEGDNRPSHEPHHRVIYCGREKLMNYSSNQDKHLVSLFLYGGRYFNASDPSYWKHFEQLKTLDMEDFGLKILPDAIGTLSELRYLGLRNNYIQEIPHSLSRLKKLEVLDIALNFMVEVEDIIWEMESLCHLYMADIIFRKPTRIDTLKNLKTWTYISVHNWMYEKSKLEMMSLTKLGIQEVDGNTDLSKLFASLAELTNLKFLILRGFRFKSMPSLDEIGVLQKLEELKLDGLITRLPSANNFPPNIINLSLVNSCLHEDPMPILEKLSKLTYLKLQNAYTGQQMVISHNGFSVLIYLVIKELWHLTNVQFEKGAMELQDLEIDNCPDLETLPKDIFQPSMKFKMKTTKKNAKKIREWSFISKVRKVDIQP